MASPIRTVPSPPRLHGAASAAHADDSTHPDAAPLPPPTLPRGPTVVDFSADGAHAPAGTIPASKHLLTRGRRPLLHLLYVVGGVMLLSHVATLYFTVSTFVARPRGRGDQLPFSAARLLRRHAKRVGGRRVAIISASTLHYATHVRNLVCNVRAATGATPVFFALDGGMLQLAREARLPVIDARHNRSLAASDKPYKFQTKEFNHVSRLKLKAVRDALLVGVDVLFTDVDVVFCDDAVARLVARARETRWASVFIQNGKSLEHQWPVEPNTGFFYVRRSAHTLALFDHLVSVIDLPRVDRLCDQYVFKQQVCEAHNGDGEAIRNATVPGRPRHFCQWKKGLVGVEILPLDTYPNGHRPFGEGFGSLKPGQLRGACQRKDIVVWHNNYCDATAKSWRMDVQGLWSVRRCDGTCKPMGPDEFST